MPVPPETGLTGFVMVEQLRSMDYRVRRAGKIGVAPPQVVRDVLDVIEPILFG